MGLDLLLLGLGLAGLAFGASRTLTATVEIGERHGLSPMFLGLPVLAIGTDLPEIVIAIDGALLSLRGVDADGVVVGNAVGSAIAQVGIVLGVVCIAGDVAVPRRDLRRDGAVLVAACIALGLAVYDGQVGRLEGAALALAYLGYLAWLLRGATRAEHFRASWDRGDGAALLRITGGLLVLLLSAEVVLARSLALAESWEISQTGIGAVLVGAGTSIPELALSFAAAAKGRAAVSVGNVIGSNILDLLLPIGLAALVVPLDVPSELWQIDLPVVLVLSALVWSWSLRGSKLTRTHGAVLLVAYLGYATFRLTGG